MDPQRPVRPSRRLVRGADLSQQALVLLRPLASRPLAPRVAAIPDSSQNAPARPALIAEDILGFTIERISARVQDPLIMRHGLTVAMSFYVVNDCLLDKRRAPTR